MRRGLVAGAIVVGCIALAWTRVKTGLPFAAYGV